MIPGVYLLGARCGPKQARDSGEPVRIRSICKCLVLGMLIHFAFKGGYKILDGELILNCNSRSEHSVTPGTNCVLTCLDAGDATSATRPGYRCGAFENGA
jgi:hypothetical protein